MNITGKATLFVKKLQGTKGEFKVYNASLSTKLMNGEWVNKYIRVRFANSLDLSGLSPDLRYNMNVIEGWITIERWADAQGSNHDEFILFVNDCEIEEAESKPKTTAKKTVKTTAKKTVKKVVK